MKNGDTVSDNKQWHINYIKGIYRWFFRGHTHLADLYNRQMWKIIKERLFKFMR
jgi:hypothetical protein